MIELKFVAKLYPNNGLKLNINELIIPKGEIVAIVGANGAGKTTLLKAMMGLGNPSYNYGHILVDGKPVEKQYEKLAFITEEGSYFPSFTPKQYAQFLADFFPKFDYRHFTKLLAYFKLDENQKIKTMSTGEKSKLEISAGFAKRAEYTIMDEPFNGKDMFTRRDFLKLMVSQMREDDSIIMTTHIIDEIENVIDRAIILHKGLIKADVTMDELREEGRSLVELMATVSKYKPADVQQFLTD
ncbi:ATP-binding cassette domain-containing protein [Paenibacillus yanchengensis]|uniref:ATP-binding cassette domain-containing protein n=1 Tax=Paenibacillus yanchengensis TaxID=2035833 RepID=A0ABW4YPB6_9BACL